MYRNVQFQCFSSSCAFIPTSLTFNQSLIGYADKLRRERAAWKVLSGVRIYIAKKRVRYRRWRRDCINRAASKIVTVFLIAKAKARVKREINRQILQWKRCV